jgi:hypothetical protein
MFALILAGVVACYLSIGALRASMLNEDALLQSFREGFRAATGTYPPLAQAQLYVRRVKRAYVLLWAYDDLLRLWRALRG